MSNIPPLTWNTPIVGENGRPTSAFLLLINELLGASVAEATAEAEAAQAAAAAAVAGVAALGAHEIVAGVGLVGGGPLSDDPITLDLEDTTVAADTYGDATHVPQITVDAQGRITEVVDVAITGGGGGGGIYAPLVNGDTPGPVPIATDDGQFIMVRIG